MIRAGTRTIAARFEILRNLPGAAAGKLRYSGPSRCKGCDSDAIRAGLHEAAIRSCIPPKSNRNAKSAGTGAFYRERPRRRHSQAE